MHGFRSSNPLLPLVLIGCCTVAGHAADDPPFDHPRGRRRTERGADSKRTDLSGPSVNRRAVGGGRSLPAQPEPAAVR